MKIVKFNNGTIIFPFLNSNHRVLEGRDVDYYRFYISQAGNLYEQLAGERWEMNDIDIDERILSMSQCAIALIEAKKIINQGHKNDQENGT